MAATETTVIQHNAEAEEIALHRLDNTGAIMVARGLVSIALGDTLGGGSKRFVKLREMGACDPATGATGHVIVLASPVY